jgi:hypothetical protein
MGWLFAASLFLRAYSLGGGTYTGIEAVSNNVQSLAEPRIATGKWTMFYMAVSLSFTAGGIILLYLLWNVLAVEGQTLNAVTFRAIIGNAGSMLRSSSMDCYGSSSRSKAVCCLWPPTRVFSAARPCSPTWRRTPGCRTCIAICRRGS